MSYNHKIGWSAACQACGLVYNSTELQIRWDGKRVCKDDFETRHPQDVRRVPRTEKALPWTSPEPPDTFTSVTYTLNGRGTLPPGAGPTTVVVNDITDANFQQHNLVIEITGGTVSSVEFKPSLGATYEEVSTSTNCSVILPVGAYLRITFSGAPTITYTFI